MTLHHRSRLAPLALAALLATAPLAQSQVSEPPMPATKSKAPVTLNFVNAEIEAVSRAIGAMLDRQIVVDPRVKGQITVTSEKAQPPQEAWRSYLAALRGMGFTVVENAGLLKVVPEAEAKLQAGTVSIGAPTLRGDQILTQIFRLNHENPNNLVAVLRPLISANNTINANPANGTLIITDYADNLQRLAKIIAALDQPAASEVEVIPVQHALASDLAPLLQRLTEGAGATNVPGAAATQAAATSIVVEPRSNSLIVRTANPVRMNAVKSLIEKLDKPIPGGGPAGNIWVVYLKNADAVKLAEVLRAAISSGTAATSGAAGTGTSGFSAGTGGVSRPSPGVAGTGATPISTGGTQSGMSAAATTPVAASASPSTGGQIQADPATNSLIISAPEPVYRQMRQVIDQLDTRRAQVYVETLIVKVDATKAAEFGFQWQSLLGNSNTDSKVVGVAGTNFGGTGNIIDLSLSGSASTSTGTATASASSQIGNGLNIGVFRKIAGFYTLGALARFLETNTGANILSTPNLVALDNEEAKIVIGSNVPFTTGSFTNTGTGNGAVNPFQTIERKDVGITLRIKSQIGEGGTVRMTVFQESSSLRSDNSQITDKSSIETTVVVDDGSMMVLGGLLKDEYGDSEGKIPGLGSIPILGNLFRNEGRTRVKSNLMLFLRPVVLRTPQAAEQMMVDRYDAIRSVQSASQKEATTLLPVEGSVVLPERQPGKLPTQQVVVPTEPAASAPTAVPAPAPALTPEAPAPGR
ncbi:type II secretion system secretin GspD [Ideonella sp.]|uniref:type II secretion system secretin GspD n=1 Tax=Ideonella sp. TaxID=1929293 RepID=UPI002B46E484|nr:type II secretion system secretin GspD [Ideonella sp.]HJV70660.1 type II secretion system secretin GspD [Ideonella sp.]